MYYSNLSTIFQLVLILITTTIALESFTPVKPINPSQSQFAQKSVIYEGRNQLGSYVVIPQTYAPDLRTVNFDNRAYSTCVTGMWIFYVNLQYNTAAGSGVEYVFGGNPDHCTNFASLGGYISSAKFAGDPNDYRGSSFTLYEGDWFQGREEYLRQDVPSLSLFGRHGSIIITGNTAWTIFDAEGYRGNSICLYPPSSPNYEPYIISDVGQISIPYGSIGSVRRGCVGKLLGGARDSIHAMGKVQQGGNGVIELSKFGQKAAPEEVINLD